MILLVLSCGSSCVLVEQWVTVQERGDVWVMQYWLTAGRVSKCGNLHCGLCGNFTGVTPLVVISYIIIGIAQLQPVPPVFFSSLELKV